MNKKILSIASIFAVSSLTVFAEEAAETVVATDATVVVEAPAPAATLFEDFVCPEVSDKLSLSMGVGYESQYVFRGIELADGIITPGMEVGYEIAENVSAYLGYWGAYGVSSKEVDLGSENDIYLGVDYTYDFVTVGLGYTAYTYTAAKDTNEIGFSLTFDTSSLFVNGLSLDPYIAMFYDFDANDAYTTEIGLSYSLPVSQYITGGEWGSLDFAYYMGYVDYASIANADAYFYTGFGVDFNVAVTEIVGFSIGLRYAYNTCDSQKSQNSNIWFGTGMSIGF